MPTVTVTKDTLDQVLALQIIVAWAGEGICEPKRLDWWRTDLIDEYGGGDLFGRLFPKTHQWSSLEAVRLAAIQVDKRKRQEMAESDAVRSLFFWGFTIDEQLAERLAIHKRGDKQPLEALPYLPLDITKPFSKAEFEETIRLPNRTVDFTLAPNGREIVGEIPEALEEQAKKLAAALLPLTDSYTMPFYRLQKH
ncbi:BREX-6 system BrxE protein [Nostoc punctiforme FACHB-252]|uniref:BREX-6 system BrxE protein n=2 Tax=Nostoc punctiforme TaxID=272131 RepID=A0ABR8HDJ1_NOSPU|nr:BREX-6 system BrxE protein [Nostoc punctiforme FACHB-252]